MNSMDSAFAIFGAAWLGICIFSLILGILMLVEKWIMFSKAGEAGWKAIIPFYNEYVEYDLFWENTYGIIYVAGAVLTVLFSVLSSVFAGKGIATFFSIVTIILSLAIMVLGIIKIFKTSKAFGHGIGFGFGLLLLPHIFYGILAFGSSDYVGN